MTEPIYTPVRLDPDLARQFQISADTASEVQDVSIVVTGHSTSSWGGGSSDTHGRGSSIEVRLTAHQALRLAQVLRQASELATTRPS